MPAGHWPTQYRASGLSINSPANASVIFSVMIITVLILALLVVLVATEPAEIS